MTDERPLVPLGTRDILPDPTELRLLLQAQLVEHMSRIRRERGVVTDPADTYDAIRRLTGAKERMDEYGIAFKAVGKSIVGELEHELGEATGEQNGVPQGNITVPTAGGDIKLDRKMTNHYDIDAHQLIAVIAAQVSAEWVERCTAVADPNHVAVDCANHPGIAPEQYAIEVAERVVELFGAAKPGVLRVRALADELHRAGDDQLAKVAKDTIRNSPSYDGVKVDIKTGRKK